MTAWTLHTDPNGDRCLWHGDTAVIRPADLGPHVPPGYRELLWAVLVAVLVQPDWAVERVANAIGDAGSEYAVLRISWDENEVPQIRYELTGEEALLSAARAALAALAPDVPPPARDPVAHVADAVSRVLPDRTGRHAPPLETRVLYQGDAVRDAVAEEVGSDE